ncbi:MAG: hypothetical protein FWD39_04970, partial [Clostridiales bacterium]|nr:hypothetical protein [Clostridiales bacterium]
MKKNDEKKQRNRFNLAFFRILLVFFAAIILLLCLTAILLCVFNQKTVEVQYKTSPEMSVVPGEQVSRANFEFDVRLPKITNQLYNLVIYDVAFSGGKTDLVFADMNRGEWEYSLDGDPWRPLILTGGERILQANATEGERMLSIRATDALDLDAE